MKIRIECTNRTLNSYGESFDVEFVCKKINGIWVKFEDYKTFIVWEDFKFCSDDDREWVRNQPIELDNWC